MDEEKVRQIAKEEALRVQKERDEITVKRINEMHNQQLESIKRRAKIMRELTIECNQRRAEEEQILLKAILDYFKKLKAKFKKKKNG